MAWDSSEMYSNGLDFFSALVEGVEPQAWERPAPPQGWTAADVLGHVGEATEMGARILRQGDMEFTRHDPPSSVIEGDPAAWWAALAADARDALAGAGDLDREVDSPMGRRSVREGLSFPAVDLFIHGWDIATATGQTVTFPDKAIAFIRALFEKVPEEVARRPGVFGPVLPAPPGANPTEELVAWTGRDPNWVAPA